MSEDHEDRSPIRVMLVEDDPDIRIGLQAILEDEASGSRCIGASASAEEALARLIGTGPGNPTKTVQPGTDPPAEPSVTEDDERPDIILMDIELPGIDGIEATGRLRASLPEIDVIMLTVREDDDAIFRSLCAGAIGYLIKSTPPSKLIAAIGEASRGGAPLSPSIARRVTRSFQAVTPSPLTGRETEILTHLCQGKSYKEIGTALFISERTVHSHLKNIYRKLEVHSKTEAMARAMRERWV